MKERILDKMIAKFLTLMLLSDMENKDTDIIRYYMGRHKVVIERKVLRKALIIHLEEGTVGNKKLGYKQVKIGDRDLVQLRTLYRRRGKDYYV